MAMTRRDAIKAAGAVAIATATDNGAGRAATPQTRPLVFGHRGCSALRPEHTLGAYAKAIADGADDIEPDLVITRDGVLVIRHENNIVETTDVAKRPEYAGRRTSKIVDGQVQNGWFVEDFTLAELKTLRATERLGSLRPESRSYDGQFQILTFDEMIDFTAAEAAARGRIIGIVPELKHSTFFRGIGLPLEDRFLATIAAHDYTRRSPVEIQSFEIANLRYLRRKLGRPANIRLMQLIDEGPTIPADVAAAGGHLTFADMITPAGLREIATYADIVAPQVRSVIPLTPDGHLGRARPIVANAHAAGLLIRLWTFRPENHFLAADFRDGDDGVRNPAGSIAEMKQYLATGVDGFFTDDPALGRAAIDAGDWAHG